MPRFSLRQLIALVAVLALLGGVYAYFNRSPVTELFGGRRNVEIVRAPMRVEAYRLGDPPGGLPPVDYISALDYPVAAGPFVVADGVAANLSKALLSRDTYGWDYAKACGPPIYGVKLSFYQDEDRVDVYLCFVCGFLDIGRDGKTFGGEDFDRAEAVFIEAVKRLFPADAEIQKLGNRGA
jgi:hypothetical protein